MEKGGWRTDAPTTRLLDQYFFLNVMASYWRCARQLPVAVTSTHNNQLLKGRDLDLVVSGRHGYLELAM